MLSTFLGSWGRTQWGGSHFRQ
uniref:Uncharacterized protein n=1 Tax=Arundo donax TaxID=35708 RepID=A0A0A9FD35_ARUDO